MLSIEIHWIIVFLIKYLIINQISYIYCYIGQIIGKSNKKVMTYLIGYIKARFNIFDFFVI